MIHLPLLEHDALLGRERLDQLAQPVVDRTVATTRGVLRQAGVAPDELAGILLVGGGSRMPLAATCLHRSFGLAPVVIDQPELAVAEGSLHAHVETDKPTATAEPAEAVGAAPPLRPAGLAGVSPFS